MNDDTRPNSRSLAKSLDNLGRLIHERAERERERNPPTPTAAEKPKTADIVQLASWGEGYRARAQCHFPLRPVSGFERQRQRKPPFPQE